MAQAQRKSISPTGTYPSQAIEALVTEGRIFSEAGLGEKQIQPSSLDLTLSAEAYQLPGSILPLYDEPVRDIVKSLARKKLDLSAPTLLDRNKVYLARLRESLRLPPGVAAYANNKSSTGRIDLATRVVCDRNPRYDKIPEGYGGELWLEIIPKSFDIVVKEGVSLNQAIFYKGRMMLRTEELENLCRDNKMPLLYDKNGTALSVSEINQDFNFVRSGIKYVEDGLLMTLDMDQDMVGFVARKTYEPVDLTKPPGQHEASEFFDPIPRPKLQRLYLERGRFYIFSTWEFIRVPPNYAVEMLAHETSVGDFRAHYAGFFDPGFGYGLNGEELGTPAVLEVRAYEDDLIVRHRQPICRMAYEKLSAPPDKLYHTGIGSHYASQRGPKLSKFFA